MAKVVKYYLLEPGDDWIVFPKGQEVPIGITDADKYRPLALIRSQEAKHLKTVYAASCNIIGIPSVWYIDETDDAAYIRIWPKPSNLTKLKVVWYRFLE